MDTSIHPLSLAKLLNSADQTFPTPSRDGSCVVPVAFCQSPCLTLPFETKFCFIPFWRSSQIRFHRRVVTNATGTIQWCSASSRQLLHQAFFLLDPPARHTVPGIFGEAMALQAGPHSDARMDAQMVRLLNALNSLSTCFFSLLGRPDSIPTRCLYDSVHSFIYTLVFSFRHSFAILIFN